MKGANFDPCFSQYRQAAPIWGGKWPESMRNSTRFTQSWNTCLMSMLLPKWCYSYTTVYCGLHERNTRVYPTVDSGITNLTHDRLLIVCVQSSVNKQAGRTEW